VSSRRHEDVEGFNRDPALRRVVTQAEIAKEVRVDRSTVPRQ
jgi:hypothetical protein